MGSNPKLQDGSTSNLDPLRGATKHSRYFGRALNGPFSEAQTNSIDFDDITAEDFGLYVSVIYPLVLCNLQLEWSDIRTEYDDDAPLSLFLRLWKLGDRLLNSKVCAIAKIEIEKRFECLETSMWDRMYMYRSEGTIKATMLSLQSDFRSCKEMGAPFEQDFIQAAGNIPPQAFAVHMEDLEDKEFRSEVMKAFAMRFANPEVTTQKRRNDERQASPAKKKGTKKWTSSSLGKQL
ncbi:hypothetical protein Daus18300_005994 [Diaporthe australafricana]|uniref:BTB domain-containing protein n=1 Tax=Diaporthe australafricana TaxID=127596 RepID=A0ABR3WX59_9PEZI